MAISAGTIATAATALAFAQVVIKWVPPAIQGIQAAIEAWQWGSALINTMITEKRNPTMDEWAELDRRTEELRALLHSDTQ